MEAFVKKDAPTETNKTVILTKKTTQYQNIKWKYENNLYEDTRAV